MVHSSMGNSLKIIERINSRQKQHEQRIMHQIQIAELTVTHYCNQYPDQTIPCDIIHLCIAFYINVKYHSLIHGFFQTDHGM